MIRGRTGRYEAASAGGETVRAFAPAPLPPDPPLDPGGPLPQALERAVRALDNLESCPSGHFDLPLQLRPKATADPRRVRGISRVRISLEAGAPLGSAVREAPIEPAADGATHFETARHWVCGIAQISPICSQMGLPKIFLTDFTVHSRRPPASMCDSGGAGIDRRRFGSP